MAEVERAELALVEKEEGLKIVPTYELSTAFECPKCGSELWVIDEETLKRGDEPTEAYCARCGWSTYV